MGYNPILGHKQWNIPELEELLKDILPKNKIFDVNAFTFSYFTGGGHGTEPST